MPLYEYECASCQHRFEVLQKISDPPPEHCPSCGGPVHKRQSAPAFQFKGTGWYVTDYARKDQPRPDGDSAGGDKQDEKKTGKTEEKNGETKGGDDGGDTQVKSVAKDNVKGNGAGAKSEAPAKPAAKSSPAPAKE